MRHSLPPVTEDNVPFAVKSGMIEIPTIIKTHRSSILDITFITPLAEVESVFFHLSGARNTFFIRYRQQLNGSIDLYPYLMLQARIADPITLRIFRGLNMLSSHLKRVLYHMPEYQSIRKSVRVELTYDSFFFLWARFLNHSEVILKKFDRTQCVTLHFDDLSMKSVCRSNQVFVIRIITRNGLALLHECLGVGVGIGLGKPRPKKSMPHAYCCVNDIITSIEVGDSIPNGYLNNKKQRQLDCNGIDFVYTVETQSLHCNIQCTKLIVSLEEVVVNRIPIGTVHSTQVVPYIGAMFFYGESSDLCRIDRISDGFAFCSYIEENHPPFHIFLQDVTPLISRFGQPGNGNNKCNAEL
jgi:hypothetical protein